MNSRYWCRLLALTAALIVLSGCKAVDGLSSLLPGATVENSKADNALIKTPFSIEKYPQNYMVVSNNKPVFEGALVRTVNRDLKEPSYITATTDYSALDRAGRTQSVTAIVTYQSMMFHSSSVVSRPVFPEETRVSGEYLHAKYTATKDSVEKGGHGGTNNNRIVQLTGYRGYLYNKSHLVAWSLNGDMQTHNVILGTRAQNVGTNDIRNPGGMAYPETLTRNYLQAHQDEAVAYQAIPIYSRSERVPRGVHVIVQSLKDPNGLRLNLWIFNQQAGVKINYKTGQFRLER